MSSGDISFKTSVGGQHFTGKRYLCSRHGICYFSGCYRVIGSRMIFLRTQGADFTAGFTSNMK
jgi:hypothetical protein